MFKHSFMKQRSIYLSDQCLTTRGRPMMKCYASLIAITRFHIAIKRVYTHLSPCTNNNAIHGSIIIWHSLCEPYTPKKRDDYMGPWLRIPMTDPPPFFAICFYDGRNGIFYSKRSNKMQERFTSHLYQVTSISSVSSCDNRNYWLIPWIVNSHGFLYPSRMTAYRIILKRLYLCHA